MPQNFKTSLKVKPFNFGLSYKLDEKDLSFKDAQNIMINDGKIEKRFGIYPLSWANLPNPISVSYFKKEDLSRYYIVKIRTGFCKINPEDGSFTILYAPEILTEDIRKHRGITWVNRHIIADQTGLYQYNGNIFTQLGSAPPTAPTIAVGTGTGSLTAGTYQAKIAFYSTSTGFESAPSSASNQLAISGTNTINVTNIPTTCLNGMVDYMRIYLKKTTQTDYVYYTDVPLGTSSYEILVDSLSSITTQDTVGTPPSGECRYICEFGKKLVAVFADDPNTVRFSLEENPDAFDEETRIGVIGDGPITGIATGLYSNTVLNPYLVIFKENKISIYSEIGGQAELVEINSRIGCVAHDTIIVRNGDVFFMSRFGWYGIKNGRLIEKDGKPYPLGDGKLNDIFNEGEFDRALNRLNLGKSFSYYLQEKGFYITFVYEASSGKTAACYVYDFMTDGFLYWNYPVEIKHAIAGEDSSGYESGILLQNNELNDITIPNLIFKTNGLVRYQDEWADTYVTTAIDPIESYGLINWIDGGDMDASYNYRECLLRVKRGQPNITLKAWVNFTYQNQFNNSFEVPDPDGTFVLDESQLDVDSLGEGRDVVTARCDVNLAGESLLLGFYQSEIDANMVISSMQLNFSKNGNRNK